MSIVVWVFTTSKKKSSVDQTVSQADDKNAYLDSEEVLPVSTVAVCIPVFNQEQIIAKLLIRVKRFADKVIVCDDKSTDSSADIAEALGVKVIRHSSPMGYNGALVSLFKEAISIGAHKIVTLDCDGVFDPIDIPTLIERLADEDVGIVVGTVSQKSDSTLQELSDSSSGLRAYSAKAIEILLEMSGSVRDSTMVIVKQNIPDLKVVSVPLHVPEKVVIEKRRMVLDPIMAPLLGVSLKYPDILYGILGVLLVLASLGLVVRNVQYLQSGVVSTNLMILSVGGFILGFVLIVSALLFSALAEMTYKGSKSERR